MRVYISVDMEGITGVVDGTQTRPGERDYERFHRVMTHEANAAIEGAQPTVRYTHPGCLRTPEFG